MVPSGISSDKDTKSCSHPVPTDHSNWPPSSTKWWPPTPIKDHLPQTFFYTHHSKNLKLKKPHLFNHSHKTWSSLRLLWSNLLKWPNNSNTQLESSSVELTHMDWWMIYTRFHQVKCRNISTNMNNLQVLIRETVISQVATSKWKIRDLTLTIPTSTNIISSWDSPTKHPVTTTQWDPGCTTMLRTSYDFCKWVVSSQRILVVVNCSSSNRCRRANSAQVTFLTTKSCREAQILLSRRNLTICWWWRSKLTTKRTLIWMQQIWIYLRSRWISV